MAIISAEEIGFFYSGGPNNSSSALSIGGNPSNFPILGSTNNLFPNVTATDAILGKTDYRCFYLYNNSSTAILADSSIYVLSQQTGGSTVQIGVAKVTEVQTVLVSGDVGSGDIVLKYDQSQFSVQWDSSTTVLAENMVSGLVSVGVLGAEVSIGTSIQSVRSISVSFKGQSDNRSHPLLELYENNLDTSPAITISREASGSPINSIATQIAVDTATPSKVEFSTTSPAQRISIGSLQPGDGFPVWIRRTTPADADFLQTDNFVFRISGSPGAASSSSSSSSSSSASISYYQQPPATLETPPEAEVEIQCVVVMTGFEYNAPTVVWEMSDDDGATWSIISTSSEFIWSISLSLSMVNESLYIFPTGGVFDQTWNGRRFRVTNSQGSVSVTSEDTILTVIPV